MAYRLRFSGTCLAAALLLGGCSPRLMAVRAMAPVLERGAEAFHEETDPEFAREAMASQLKLLEALLKNDPANPKLLALAGQGFCGYAFLFLEDAEPERARELYRRGRDWGLKLLDLNPALRGLGSMPPDALEAALRKAGKSDAPALFWAAYGWAGWINLSKDSPEAVAGLPKAAAMMRRVQELRPGYYYAGPDLFLGSYYSSLPRMLGGDPEKAKRHFEAALEATRGRFLMAKVLYARYAAVAGQDEGLFRRLLSEVESGRGGLDGAELADAVARLKAKRLLERLHELF